MDRQGRWTKVRHAEGDVIWPTWAEGAKIPGSLLIALESRTHPVGCPRGADSITGVYYDDDEVRAQRQTGERPMQEDMIHAFWARWNEHFSWRRECMMWDLPTLLSLYGNKHTLRTLYNYWCDLPIAMTKDYRGKNAPESATAQRQKHWHQAQRRTVDFLRSTGIPHPETTEEWKTIVSEMGKWMAMSAIHSHTPAAVMELPVSATRDSKEAMLFRALCDERITLPAELFRDTPIHERIERLYGGGIIEARRYWRCNTEHFWTAKVTDTWLASAVPEAGLLPRGDPGQGTASARGTWVVGNPRS